jgi:hypothetical protein
MVAKFDPTESLFFTHPGSIYFLGGARDMVAASRELLVAHPSTLANPRCTLLNAL